MILDNILGWQNYRTVSNIVINFETQDHHREYSEKNIVFCKTDLLLRFFQEIKDLDIKVILISFCSDYEINNHTPVIDINSRLICNHINIPFFWDGNSFGNTTGLFRLKPPQIIKWFAQNTNVNHPDITPLPIGFANTGNTHDNPYWVPCDPEYLNQMDEITLENISKKEKNTEKIYVNIADTHPNRSHVRNLLKDSNIADIESENLIYSDYMNKMDKYLFVASPRGNGIDCHRTWEALYLGSIPIVDKHFIYDTYDLPIWQVETWDEVLDESKRSYWINRYLSSELFTNISELSANYWRSRILNEYDRL